MKIDDITRLYKKSLREKSMFLRKFEVSIDVIYAMERQESVRRSDRLAPRLDAD